MLRAIYIVSLQLIAAYTPPSGLYTDTLDQEVSNLFKPRATEREFFVVWATL